MRGKSRGTNKITDRAQIFIDFMRRTRVIYIGVCEFHWRSVIALRMTRAAIRSRTLTHTAILAMVVAVASFAPTPALASCGDYVTVSPHAAPHVDHVMRSPIAIDLHATSRQGVTRDDMSDEAAGIAAAPTPIRTRCGQCPRDPASPGKAPCRGPWCSNNPGPLATPPPTVERSYQQSGLFQPAASPEQPDAIPLDASREPAHGIRHIFAIYHPPRPA